jgi:predicted enzyme related to lactoylglutathione lyase
MRKPIADEAPARVESAVDPRAGRPNGISFLEIPSADLRVSAAFYRSVFGWQVSARPSGMAFENGTGHVIGHWTTDRSAPGDAGTHFYVYVESVPETLRKVASAGGQVLRQPYREGKLRIATVRDPSGNVVGIRHADS